LTVFNTTTVYNTTTTYNTSKSTGESRATGTSRNTTTTFGTSRNTGESRSTGTSRNTTTTFGTSRGTAESRSTNTAYNTNTSFNTSRGTDKSTSTAFNTTTTYNTSQSTTTTYSTAAALTAFDSTTNSNFNFVCQEFMGSTYYGNSVSSGLPQVSSNVYTNSGGTSVLSAGYYGAKNLSGFSPTHYFQIGAGGVVTSLTQCGGGFGGPSDRRLKKNIRQYGQSLNGINIYLFEYKDEKYGKGVWQGVMADEVEHIEGAVINMGEYKWVDYSKVDVEFKKI